MMSNVAEEKCAENHANIEPESFSMVVEYPKSNEPGDQSK